MDAFQEIKEITGEAENEKLVERFIEMEDKNFAMFTCKLEPYWLNSSEYFPKFQLSGGSLRPVAEKLA